MKWFKHYSTARNDERISLLEDKTSIEGYGFYFKILEIVAEAVDETDKCEVTYSISRWGRQANISTKKFLYLLQCCSDVGLMSVQRASDNITVKMPNLLKIRDNHTRNLQATVKQDKDIDKDKDTTKKKVALPDGFDLFWNEYPKKKNKDGAMIAWKKAKPNVDEVLEALIWQKQLDDWKKDNGQYIPYPSTYLNNGGWKDEKPAVQPKRNMVVL